MCPICQQEVALERQTDRYKARWRLEVLPSIDDGVVKIALLAIYLRHGLVDDVGFHAALQKAQAAYPGKTINELQSLGDAALVILDLMRRR